MNFYKMVTDEDVTSAMKLFNDSVSGGEMLYKPFLSVESFKNFFIERNQKDLQTIAMLSDDKSTFVSGCYINDTDKGYVTVVVVAPENRRKGYGVQAIKELEKQILDISNGKATKFEIIFFNPMNLEWIIPNTNNHDHPNSPGIDVSSLAYIFFKNCGYRDSACQNSYHVNLSSYSFPDEIVARIEKLKEKNIEIVVYDANKHTGLDELFDNLQNEMWRKDIMTNVSLPDGGNPVLIVNHNGKVMGFTGPLSVQPSGRGFFCGIGVHSDCRGNGAGKVLFSFLCTELKAMGAEFMTLFTGELNPARNIYEAAGFKIVRTWANMRKEVK